MHDLSTRALQIRRQKSATSAALLAAVLFLSPIAFADALGAPKTTEESAVAVMAPKFQTKVAHDIAIEIVKPGNEGLELSARLSESGGLIERDISWTLRDAQGGIVYDRTTELAHVALPPGDYSVEARYGSASFSQSLTLLEANRLMVSFVLEVGGIRVLPRVQGLGLTSAQTQSLVYALSGADKGKLITISKVPGEILRVKSGDYRIESRFATGNAVVVVDVHVNSGLMSAVEIDHAAGLARLSYVGAPDAHVSWLVTDGHGEQLPAIDGLSASVVLTPGAYIAKAQIGTELLTASFDIAAGQERDILLGN
ncbi:MAG: hypothetical protein Q8L53_01880 [Aestuariivirga sp.]|nr:hypothetical protein [Aestuariivirga sp.]